MDDTVELFGACTTRRSTEQHQSTSVQRQRATFVHEISSANLLPSQFEQVLQQGHVPDRAWTNLLEQDGPPSEAVERPEGNDLEQSEGDIEKSNPTVTAAHIEQNESAFTIQGEEYRKAWQEFHRRQKLQWQPTQSCFAKRDHGCKSVNPDLREP